jgi:hypothetical protein
VLPHSWDALANIMTSSPSRGRLRAPSTVLKKAHWRPAPVSRHRFPAADLDRLVVIALRKPITSASCRLRSVELPVSREKSTPTIPCATRASGLRILLNVQHASLAQGSSTPRTGPGRSLIADLKASTIDWTIFTGRCPARLESLEAPCCAESRGGFYRQQITSKQLFAQEFLTINSIHSGELPCFD